jgi:hypothetical protein
LALENGRGDAGIRARPLEEVAAAASPQKAPSEDWERALKKQGLPEHLTRHLVTMAELNRAGRYGRMAGGVERVTGRPALSVREFVSLHAQEFGGRRS